MIRSKGMGNCGYAAHAYCGRECPAEAAFPFLFLHELFTT